MDCKDLCAYLIFVMRRTWLFIEKINWSLSELLSANIVIDKTILDDIAKKMEHLGKKYNEIRTMTNRAFVKRIIIKNYLIILIECLEQNFGDILELRAIFDISYIYIFLGNFLSWDSDIT